jgi:hypothetical protein
VTSTSSFLKLGPYSGSCSSSRVMWTTKPGPCPAQMHSTVCAGAVQRACGCGFFGVACMQEHGVLTAGPFTMVMGCDQYGRNLEAGVLLCATASRFRHSTCTPAAAGSSHVACEAHMHTETWCWQLT